MPHAPLARTDDAPVREKPKRGALIRRFARAAAKVVVTLVAAASLAYGGYLHTNYAGKGEPLTPAETALVEGVFGDEIDATKIRKHFRETSVAFRLAPKTTAGMVLPPLSHIDFYGEKNKSADYAQDSAALADLFMHEVTHVWQNQNWRWSLHHLDKVRKYDYTLNDRSRFDNFALEQKAEIIGDYTRIWLHPQGKVQSGKEPTAEDLMLRDVVEARFPRARETREALPPQAKPAPQKQPAAPKMPNS